MSAHRFVTMTAIAAGTAFSAVSGARADDRIGGPGTTLEEVLDAALSRNPGLAEAREQVQEREARASAARRLPDPELKYEQWGVPLGRPYALDQAQTLMLGLRQSFPAPGSLAARGRSARDDAEAAADAARSRRLDIVRQVKHAFWTYARADREYWIHLEHVDLAQRAVDLTRGEYRTGRATQQDVLRAIVELSRLHNDVAGIEQERTSARALLNTLMARPPGAPLGRPMVPETPPAGDIRLVDLERRLDSDRPELAAARRAIRSREASAEAARIAGRWPTFMVGADYWLMPQMEPHHAYGAMVSVSLPWLNPRHREEAREAEHARSAEEHALESAKNAALYELHDAAARVEAARQSLGIISRDLLPQARQSFEAAQSGFAAGQGTALALLDSLRSYLQVRVEESRARARLEMAVADLERAVGGDLAGGHKGRP